LSLLIYFETNWILGAVLGQDLRAEELLASSKAEIELAIPSICLMEAIITFHGKSDERERLERELKLQISQVERSRQIPLAQQLLAQLIQASLTNDKLLNKFVQRLDDFLVRVARRAELIPLLSEAVELMVLLRHETETKLGRQDALILACIITHSKEHQSAKRAFLTGNIHDFDVGPVRSLLEDNGVKFFSSTDRVLGWASAARRSSS
jgi:hypothetical protein